MIVSRIQKHKLIEPRISGSLILYSSVEYVMYFYVLYSQGRPSVRCLRFTIATEQMGRTQVKLVALYIIRIYIDTFNFPTQLAECSVLRKLQSIKELDLIKILDVISKSSQVYHYTSDDNLGLKSIK